MTLRIDLLWLYIFILVWFGFWFEL